MYSQSDWAQCEPATELRILAMRSPLICREANVDSCGPRAQRAPPITSWFWLFSFKCQSSTVNAVSVHRDNRVSESDDDSIVFRHCGVRRIANPIGEHLLLSANIAPEHPLTRMHPKMNRCDCSSSTKVAALGRALLEMRPIVRESRFTRSSNVRVVRWAQSVTKRQVHVLLKRPMPLDCGLRARGH